MSNNLFNDQSQGIPLGVMENARSGLVNKIKVENDSLQRGGGMGGAVVGSLGGLAAGMLGRGRLGAVLKRFAAPAGAVGGGLAGGYLGRGVGGLAGTSIPTEVDQPMTPGTIGAVAKFINKQAGAPMLKRSIDIGDGMHFPLALPAGMLAASAAPMTGLALGAATAPKDYFGQSAARGLVHGTGAGIGAGLGALAGSVASNGGELGTALGTGIGGLGGYLAGRLATGKAPWKKDKEQQEATAAKVAYLTTIATQIRPTHRNSIKTAIACLKQGYALPTALRRAYPNKTAAERLSLELTIEATTEQE